MGHWGTHTKKYTRIYNITPKPDSHRPKTNAWLGKAKPCKWLRKALRQCFCEMCNNTPLGLHRILSNLQCTVLDTFKILACSVIFRHIKTLSIIKAYLHILSLLRNVQVSSVMFRFPRIFTSFPYSEPWHIYNRKDIQNHVKLWSGILRTFYSENSLFTHIQAYLESCVTLAYADTRHIWNPGIFRTLL